MVMGGGGVVPPTLLDERRLPSFYLDAIASCGAHSATTLPHTPRVYTMMVRSGLSRSVLSSIWSAVNRSLPGQLNRPEFFSCLALIALAQQKCSLGALSGMSVLPVPNLDGTSSPSGSADGVSEGGSSGQAVEPASFLPLTPLAPSTGRPSQLPHQQPLPTSTAALLVNGLQEGEKENEKDQLVGRRREVLGRTMRTVEKVMEECLAPFEHRTSDVCREVCRTERGWSLVDSLGRLTLVAHRIAAADGSKGMRDRAMAVEKGWRRLLGMRGDDTGEAVVFQTPGHTCNMCCISGAALSFGGRFYHAECANLWVNNVECVLPTLPE